MKYIQLTQGKMALVDDEDYEYLSQWKWHYSHNGYAVRWDYKDKKPQFIIMHRLIANTPNNMDTDHSNHDGLDNRRCNLRICTTSQNNANRVKCKNNTSGLKGVSWHKRVKKWQAQIKYHHKVICLGYYENAEDAADAYRNAAIIYHGRFAYIDRLPKAIDG